MEQHDVNCCPKEMVQPDELLEEYFVLNKENTPQCVSMSLCLTLVKMICNVEGLVQSFNITYHLHFALSVDTVHCLCGLKLYYDNDE